ncbi:pyridoxal kinase PdxY [Solicola sp. PLA-1-18]|uniref:pyridoxal kinase PdxY n=1 Tax=Solicola sp. PLA-1-18 TaxID=3380532 RepID=UPI003B7E6520
MTAPDLTARAPQVLSVQSAVAYGHVGNSAAVFPLQRLGFEVWPVHTVNFSNHTGYQAWRGPVLPAADVASVVQGVAERGVLGDVDAVLSGYQGAQEIGAVVLDAVAQVKAANPRAIYCADPVMGDYGRGVYVREGIPELMRDLVVPAADVTTPNQFELEHLTGRSVRTMDDLLAAVEVLRSWGPRTVLVTSVDLPDHPGDELSMVAVSEGGAWVVTTPRLELAVTAGTGDTTAAIFLAHLLRDGDLPLALSRTASSIFGILELTARTGAREIELVRGQDLIASPPDRFEAVAL